MGKGEIARYEQFLLFPQCFLKACFPEASKGVIVWEWVNQVRCFPLNYSYPDLRVFPELLSAVLVNKIPNKEQMNKCMAEI